MLSRLRAFASLFRELGPRWTLFRLAYAIRLRTGLIRLQMPKGEWKDYKKYITGNPGSRMERAFFPPGSKPHLINAPWNPQTAIDEADRLLKGEIKYFSHQFIQTSFPPIWHHDYVTDSNLDPYKHWSQIPHDSSADIKFIWEPNRFAFVYTLVRAYVSSQDEKYPEAFWTLVEDWAKHNPPNTGPNWMDGQEIALRLMAWTFGYRHFVDSPSSTPERIEQFTLYIAAQADRIYKNIGYAISTRSNHTISEAFGLWVVGLLFPELNHGEKYLSLGKRILEEEAANQILHDGSYSMYSLNYHRFILHIYLYAIRIGDINHIPLSTELKRSVANSITCLSRLIDPQTGEMPVYGSNDGALVLPLNNCDFTDFRPLLQLGWYITKGERLFDPGAWDEDIFWLCGESIGRVADRIETIKESTILSFPYGGIYLLRNTHSHALIRCTDFTSRPSHADQLHVDLWIHGHNLAIDAGTYLYSGEGHWRNGLAHTSVHNTVTVDDKDQMTMVSRFTWTNWSKGKVLKHDKNYWQGEHDGYKPVSHERSVTAMEGDRWLVVDHLNAQGSHHYALHWLLNDYLFEHSGDSILLSVEDMKYKLQVGTMNANGSLSIVRADPATTRGWRSRYYGHKEPAISVMLEADQPQVMFWTFFGFENDVVEIVGDTLKINSETIQLP